MSSMNECFSKRLEELIDEFPEHNLIFFKGFGIEQMRQLVTHANAILNDETLLQNEYLDINALDDKWLELASSIKCAKEPLVGFYEELLAIRQLLPRIKVDKIVIVENNLLSPWVPCYFPYHDAEMLFDYWQTEHEVSDENPLSQLVQLYGDVKLLKNQKALFLPLKLDDERIVEIPFWTGNIIEQEDIADNAEYIEVGSNRDWEYCLDITQGKAQSAVFLQNSETLSARTRATIYASKLLGFDVSIDELDLYQEKIEYSDSQFTGILQKYWGSAAHFRPLLFYKDPDRSQETETITQGQIIAEIVDQCEAAQNKEAYSNIFITAPTGSGKSILFQIPALYLAEKYNLVTIVVSPLIALMNDQVDQLQRERGISIAACINSSMSIEERGDVIEQIHMGKKSLLYLAPELLLTTHLQSFLGGRQVGMVVIDEAHGPYCKFQQGIAARTVQSRNQRASDITVYSAGKTFLVNMAQIWENCYPDRSFGMFKKEFFEHEFSDGEKTYTIAPRVRTEIRYADDFSTVSQRVEIVINAITKIFEKYKNGETKQFSQKQFETELMKVLGEKVVPHDKISMLLDIFTESVDERAAYSQSRSRIRVLRARKAPGADETSYFVSNASYAQLPNFFIHQIEQCVVNAPDNTFFRFYPLIPNKQIEIMPLLRFMELLGLATYEIRGGEKAEVFIRINDPEKIERLATSGRYTNGVLQNIQEHHRNNENLLTAFFTANMSDEERWEVIEQYFLGNGDYVRQVLHMSD